MSEIPTLPKPITNPNISSLRLRRHLLSPFLREIGNRITLCKRPLPKPDPITPESRAFTKGIIDTLCAVISGVQGLSDGKVYHNYAIGSEEELSWSSGCAWTAERLMRDQMAREALREEAPINTRKELDEGHTNSREQQVNQSKQGSE